MEGMQVFRDDFDTMENRNSKYSTLLGTFTKMITFTLLLVAKWLGFTVEVDQELELKLMDIIKLGIGGYVVSRGVEKVADTVTKNIDIPFLKKKNRDIK